MEKELQNKQHEIAAGMLCKYLNKNDNIFAFELNPKQDSDADLFLCKGNERFNVQVTVVDTNKDKLNALLAAEHKKYGQSRCVCVDIKTEKWIMDAIQRKNDRYASAVGNLILVLVEDEKAGDTLDDKVWADISSAASGFSFLGVYYVSFPHDKNSLSHPTFDAVNGFVKELKKLPQKILSEDNAVETDAKQI